MLSTRDLDFRRFWKLEEMIGDGLHYEEAWISREYNTLLRQLFPEIKKKDNKERVQIINKQVKEKLKTDRCECGGELKQTRSGSKTVRCILDGCGKRYKYKKRG